MGLVLGHIVEYGRAFIFGIYEVQFFRQVKMSIFLDWRARCYRARFLILALSLEDHMKKILSTALLCLSFSAQANDLVLLSSDELSKTFLDTSSIKRSSSKQIDFQIKQVFNSQRDMMGLQHNAALMKYKISCQLGLILFQQKFLLNDDEVVWTHPASNKKQKAALELSDDVVGKICRTE
jgi:hypothetical protein